MIDLQKIIPQKILIKQVFLISHPGDPEKQPVQVFANKACDNIDFIAVGGRNEQVGVLDSGISQYPGAGAGAQESLNIQIIRHAFYLFGIIINNDHVLAFLRQFLRRMKTHFSGAQNDHFHDTALH